VNHDATVTAGDIARLADVGRAAVSNWRRRYEDFPRPVGGTATSPLFSLREVEDWLRRNGKTFEVGLAFRVWQRLRTAGDDLRLGALVAGAGGALLAHAGIVADLPGSAEPLAPDLRALLAELGAEEGAAEAFEFLCERYVEAHSRQLANTPRAVAEAMARLANPDGGTLLDPACGLGTLLLGAPVRSAFGQEADGTTAAIAAARLLLRGVETTVVAGDALRADGHHEPADAVACDPPFNERAWGYAELTGDPRWEYGLPPRGEPELAWAQHCLACVRPGGLVAILMPPAAAARRAGRRIRGNLLRAGALRAVGSLEPAGPDLWLLRRPEPGDRPAPTLLLVVAEIETAATAMREHLAGRETGTGVAVPVIDLLDDDIDLSPARHQRDGSGQDLAGAYQEAAERFATLRRTPPELLDERRDLPVTTIGELVRAGLLTVAYAAARMAVDGGELPVLTGDDLAGGREPTGRAAPAEDLVELADGDVVVSPLGAARVVRDSGAVLGPHLARYRPDPDRLDPEFLAGILRFADSGTAAGSSRFDRRRTRLPRLPITEQRAYGRRFRELAEFQAAARTAAELSETLVRLGFDGLVGGQLGSAG
jgi:hypothetical protein